MHAYPMQTSGNIRAQIRAIQIPNPGLDDPHLLKYPGLSIFGVGTEHYIVKMQLCDHSCTKTSFVTEIFTPTICTKIVDDFD